jgi:hypothetical protein
MKEYWMEVAVYYVRAESLTYYDTHTCQYDPQEIDNSDDLPILIAPVEGLDGVLRVCERKTGNETFYPLAQIRKITVKYNSFEVAENNDD